MRGSSGNSSTSGSRFVPPFMRRQVNNRQANTSLSTSNSPGTFGKSKCWTFDRIPHILSGNTINTPKIAPPTAPTEHKKTILRRLRMWMLNGPSRPTSYPNSLPESVLRPIMKPSCGYPNWMISSATCASSPCSLDVKFAPLLHMQWAAHTSGHVL